MGREKLRMGARGCPSIRASLSLDVAAEEPDQRVKMAQSTGVSHRTYVVLQGD